MTLAEIVDRVTVEVDFDRTDETARDFALAVAKAVVEECAKIAAAHRAPERKPVSRVFREEIGHEIVMEIQAEERGERIAAECIAKEIRAWIP